MGWAQMCRIAEQKQATSALKIMLLQLDSNVTAANRPLLTGCVHGVHNVSSHLPWAVPVIFAHFAALTVLRDGDLWCLKTITAGMQPETMKKHEALMKVPRVLHLLVCCCLTHCE
jgi:hypothetical protein